MNSARLGIVLEAINEVARRACSPGFGSEDCDLVATRLAEASAKVRTIGECKRWEAASTAARRPLSRQHGRA
jgi:hypothetical protein